MKYDDKTIAAKYIIKTHYIVRVIEFYPEKQTVDVMQDSLEFINEPNGDYIVNNEFGIDVPAAVAEPFILVDIPVKQLRWGQFAIQACPKKGDTGYLEIFTDDIRTWAREGKLSVPNTARKFDIHSCVFVPFVPNLENKDPDYPADNTQLVIKSNHLKITLNDTDDAQSINVEGDVNLAGDVSVDGDISVSGKIEASGDIVAGKGSSKEVSLLNHRHAIPAQQVVVAAEAAVMNPTAISTTKAEEQQ